MATGTEYIRHGKSLGPSRNTTCLLTIALLLLTFLYQSNAYGQESTSQDITIVPLTLNVSNYGTYDILCFVKDKKAYIPISDLFNLLRINSTYSKKDLKITGFVINEENTYEIDASKNTITHSGQLVKLQSEDLIATADQLYLESSYLGTIFGLQTKFNFRQLELTFSTALDLPYIKAMERERLYKNLGISNTSIPTDTSFIGKLSGLKGGVLDWAFTNTQISGRKNEFRGIIGMGAGVLGGETQLNLFFNTDQPFSVAHQSFRWRHVNEASNGPKEIIVGTIQPNMISTIYNPVYGVTINSASTLTPTLFGNYRIQDKTKPGWLVELYINEALVSYKKADQDGGYYFDVPLIYGNTNIKLMFIGPWGEEKIQEKHIKIPYTFTPRGSIQYSLNGGKILDGENGHVFHGKFSYGLSNHVSVGGGLEYIGGGDRYHTKPVPYAEGSVRIGSDLLFSTNHYFGVRSQFSMNYDLPWNARLRIDYSNFKEGQKALFHNMQQQKRIVLELPFSKTLFSSFNRISYSQINFPGYTVSNAEWNTSFNAFGVNANISTMALFRNSQRLGLYSLLRMSFQNSHNLSVSPELKYDYQSKSLRTMRLSLEKRFMSKGSARIFFERDFIGQQNYLGVSARFNLNHFQLSLTERHSKKYFATTQSANGSILFDSNDHELLLSNSHSSGSGSLVLVAFLDINGNGVHDKKEPILPNFKFNINGNFRKHKSKKGGIHVLNLTPYKRYIIKIDPGSFDHIAWVVKNPTIAVDVVPNQIQKIQIPVSVMGEISGFVSLKDPINTSVKRGIPISIYTQKGHFVGNTHTATDGYFNYFGLLPGNYTISIDSSYLERMNLIASNPILNVYIGESSDGYYLDGLDFELSRSK